MRKFLAVCALATVLVSPTFAQEATYGLALHGEPKYPASFTHFDYSNPDAPKGGDIVLSGIGSFITLNPFTLKAPAADGSDMVFETLMVQSTDEPFSEYGWVAETVTVAPDRTWISYTLRPQARFHDGSPITADDVIFSFETLRDKGHPYFRSYYKDVVKAEKLNAHSVKFVFKDGTNTELPMIMGQLPVLSKKFWQGKDFSETTLSPIMGSGPYEISDVVPGRSITLKRVKDWWAKDLPVNRGRYNYDTVHYDYYRDTLVALEAFLAGHYDFRLENAAKNWAQAYNTPAVKDGRIKKEAIKNELPSTMQGFIYNTRRDVFKDVRVREALDYALDFEWLNKSAAYGAYTRLNSYFDNSELASHGLPSKDELEILTPYKDKLPASIFTTPYASPTTDGNGDNRANLHKANDLLRDAGWTLKNGVLVNAQGKPFEFEIITSEQMFERWIQPFIRNLERLGIKATFRVVDTSQYQRRMDSFDYDMTVGVFPASLSPGNEEFDTWSSTRADVEGSKNVAGVKDPVVDALIDKLLKAKSREELVTVTHALDRVLLAGHYMIPNWYIGSFRVAYWDKFGKPDIAPKYGLDVMGGWWIKPDAKAPTAKP